jgi:hypothetical protein
MRRSALAVALEPLEPRVFFAAAGEKILFIRGGSGTAGFLTGGTPSQRDSQLSDINDNSTAANNNGWGALAALLRGDGFVVEQLAEGPAANNTPVNLAGIDLSRYKLIVFGSNNATYPKASIDAIESFVRAGGGALFISDANFGSSYGDAPSSDQQFLDRFGLIMNQDKVGTPVMTRAGGDFVQSDHPILAGVNAFDGEGVSVGVRSTPTAGVTPQVIVRATAGSLTRNNDNATKGSDRAVTTLDGALIVAAAGLGRVAVAFDRNTFFNNNGTGTSLARFDNSRYAKNLFEWSAGIDSGSPRVLSADFGYEFTPNRIRFAFNADVHRTLDVSDLVVKNLTTGATIAPTIAKWDSSNQAGYFQFASLLPQGNYTATLKASGISDPALRKLPADYLYRFYVLNADGNRDRKVDTLDLNALAMNFGESGRGFSKGNYDFDYTAGGRVTTTDFNFLAASFGKSQPTPAAVPAAAGRAVSFLAPGIDGGHGVHSSSTRSVEDLLF